MQSELMLIVKQTAWCAAVLTLTAACLVGCGNQGYPGAVCQPVVAPSDVEVVSESIPMGLGATFTASSRTWGCPEVKFQWAKDGAPIPGAVSGTYTTPPTTFSDSGTAFTVTISNSAGSITSAPAILTVTARAPKEGDLRFQQVDAPDTVNGGNGGLFTAFDNLTSWSMPNSYGTPMWLGPGICIPPPPLHDAPCSWGFEANNPFEATTPNANYQGFVFEKLESELNTLAVPNTVVTSLDLEPDDGVFGVVWMQSNHGSGYDMAQHIVSLSDLEAAANKEGALSRVITAVSFNANEVTYLSYGWQSDTSTTYDTQVATSASVDDAPILAANLAAGGYIITAMGVGSGGTYGVVLIGTRVHGDTVARPFTMDVLECFKGYAVVGLIAPDNTYPSQYWLCER